MSSNVKYILVQTLRSELLTHNNVDVEREKAQCVSICNPPQTRSHSQAGRQRAINSHMQAQNPRYAEGA